MKINTDILTAPEAFEKATRYCCVEERCRSQVAEKLKQWNVPPNMTDGILIGLENAGFLNEDRYSELFVRSKVRHNNWGRYKIIHALRSAYVKQSSIQYGLSLLDEQIYLDALKNVIRKAQKTIRATNQMLKQRKIIQHAVSKGFETDLIIKNLNEEE